MIRYGNDVNYWIQTDNQMDISRGAETAYTCETSTFSLTFDPKRSAMVIIDMQNFFLSERMGRGEKGRSLVIPIVKSIEKARKMGMAIIWLNWGVRSDLANMSPGVLRAFHRSGIGFGDELPDNMGRLLVKGSWSAALVPELEAHRQDRDIWIDKHRTSGFYGTELGQILNAQGITTLFFAGVNTDQCVFGTLQDAYCIGYDCVLLADCTATTSPEGAYESVLYNVERSYGFVTESSKLSQANFHRGIKSPE